MDLWTKNYLLSLVQEGMRFHVPRAVDQIFFYFPQFLSNFDVLGCFGKLKGDTKRFFKGKVGFWGNLDLALKFMIDKVFVQRSTTLCHLLCCQIHKNERKSISFFFPESEIFQGF